MKVGLKNEFYKKIKRARILAGVLLFSCLLFFGGQGFFLPDDFSGAIAHASSDILEQIPEYSGDTYTVVNDNVPEFDEADFSTVSFEIYSDLDELGRCGVAYANLGVDLMPTEERGDISSIYPTGWVQNSYDSVSGGYLYNRCHLIAFELAAENDNERNLITGTRYFNVEGMLPFENMVCDYIKETENHVLYRVTPVFEGDNLVANGVQMEAESVEDDGDGILFNIFCYNVQPGIVIDYATGENYSADSSDSEDSYDLILVDPGDTAAEGTDGEGILYILNTNTYKFHYPDCRYATTISDKNRSEYTGSREDVIAMGYEPCKGCNP